jgi:hypothetical protein
MIGCAFKTKGAGLVIFIHKWAAVQAIGRPLESPPSEGTPPPVASTALTRVIRRVEFVPLPPRRERSVTERQP